MYVWTYVCIYASSKYACTEEAQDLPIAPRERLLRGSALVLGVRDLIRSGQVGLDQRKRVINGVRDGRHDDGFIVGGDLGG